jgi:hypothetical protein
MGNAFDIDFKLLPPKLQMQLWLLALDANTSKVNIAYRPGSFLTSLAYNYGDNVEASLSVRRFSTTVGVNPSSGDVSLGLVFRGFRFGASANVTREATGVSIGYGASLLPFPMELSGTFSTQRLSGFRAWRRISVERPTTPSHGISFTAMMRALSATPSVWGSRSPNMARMRIVSGPPCASTTHHRLG